MPEQDVTSHIVDSQTMQYASSIWGKEIIAVPAMIMALGIFLLYAGQFFFSHLIGETLSNEIIFVLSCSLGLFTLYFAHRFIHQIIKNRKVVWDYTLDHFTIGTWIAGVNIVGSIFLSIEPLLAKILFAIGITLWIFYMFWLVKMVFRGEMKSANLTGVVFLTTVATQSVVVTFIRVFPLHIADFIYGLISLNVLGIVFYWISFALVWVAPGIIEPLTKWVPQNNITHGALSITMLAAQMIEDNMPGTLPYFHFVIQAAWIAATVFFLLSIYYEIRLIVMHKKPLLKFRMSNYARNFTYGMFFACSYYGYTYQHPSIMKTFLNPTILFVLAVVVLLVNVWEMSNQIFISLFNRSLAKVKVS